MKFNLIRICNICQSGYFTPLFATKGMFKLKDGRVHLRYSREIDNVALVHLFAYCGSKIPYSI